MFSRPNNFVHRAEKSSCLAINKHETIASRILASALENGAEQEKNSEVCRKIIKGINAWNVTVIVHNVIVVQIAFELDVN